MHWHLVIMSAFPLPELSSMLHSFVSFIHEKSNLHQLFPIPLSLKYLVSKDNTEWILLIERSVSNALNDRYD